MSKKGENIYKRKDGRWEGRYIKSRTESGKHIYGYIYGKHYQDVSERLLEKKDQYSFFYESTGHYIKSSASLEQWVQQWLAGQQDRIKPATYISYDSKMNNHVLPVLGECSLHELTAEKLELFVNELTSKLSQATANSVCRVLNTCLEAAVSQQRLFANPLKNIQENMKVKAVTNQAIVCFDPAEKQRLAAFSIFEKDFPILFALETGLKIGELVCLRWDNIHWGEQKITIRQSLQPDGVAAKRKVQLDSAGMATYADRQLPLSDALQQQLVSWREATNMDYIFPNTKGGPMEPRTLRHRFKNLKERARVSDLPFSALRHTFAVQCIEQQLPIHHVSYLLGHQSTKFTEEMYRESVAARIQPLVLEGSS